MEIAAMAGFDCLWSDMEHVPNDLAVIEKGSGPPRAGTLT